MSGSYSQVAKVESFGMIYRVEGVGEVFVQDDVEVLVCDPPITTITEIPQASEYFKLKNEKIYNFLTNLATRRSTTIAVNPPSKFKFKIN